MKRVKEVVDKLRPTITRLYLSSCSISGQAAERLPGVLAQWPGLFELDLSGNKIGDEGAGSAAAVPSVVSAQVAPEKKSDTVPKAL